MAKKVNQIESSKLIHEFLTSTLLHGRVLRNYKTPVFNRLLKIPSGQNPYEAILKENVKNYTIKVFVQFLENSGYQKIQVINDLKDPNQKHPLLNSYIAYLNQDEQIKEYYIKYVYTSINQFLMAVEDLPEWLITPNIFSYLKNEPTRITYSRIVGEFLEQARSIPDIDAYLKEKGIDFSQMKERFFPSKEELPVLTEAQRESVLSGKELIENVLLRMTLLDNIKLEQLLVATVNDFDDSNNTLLGQSLSAETASMLIDYIQKSYKRKKELLFIKPKPLLVTFSKRAALRAGLGEEFQNMNGLRPLFANKEEWILKT